jgi:hypothetical protein
MPASPSNVPCARQLSCMPVLLRQCRSFTHRSLSRKRERWWWERALVVGESAGQRALDLLLPSFPPILCLRRAGGGGCCIDCGHAAQ